MSSSAKVHAVPSTLSPEGGSLGATACPMLYPMYAVPVDVVLGLSAFEPHQQMLKASQLVEVTPGMNTIFVSHQWLGHQHPDPDGNQLGCLQRVLQRLANGELDVENDFKQQVVFKERSLKSKKWWKESMKITYIWLDYMCMPQLSCVQTEDTHLSVVQPFSHNAQNKISNTSDMQDNSKGQTNMISTLADISSTPPRFGFDSDKAHLAACIKAHDHSKGNTDDAQLLKKAVESLPAYVELSSMMLVLVPTDEHQDREGEVVDWCSWRRRGWCRLEFVAAKLSRGNMKIMVVKGPECVPEFIFSADALQLPPGLGDFACCAIDHDFGNGKVPCDKIAIERVLNLLIEAKLNLLKAEKKWFELRYYATSQHRYFEGLEDTRGERRGSVLGEKLIERTTTLMAIKRRMGGLAALKEKLAWRDDNAERKETGTSGASLLFWAAMANDVSSVRELLHAGCKFVNHGLAKNVPELSMFKRMTPLAVGMMFARWEVVELLLDGGADPMASDTRGQDALMWASFIGKDTNIRSWMARFPDWNLERREVEVGMTALHFAAISGTNKRPTLELLLLKGANPLTVGDNGAHLLGFAAVNPDLLPEEMQWLLDYNGTEIRQHGLHLGIRPRTLKWRVIFSATRQLSRLGKTNKMVQELASWEGITPLHDAGRLGHHELADVLTAAGAPTEARTAQGLTPLQLAHVFHGGKVPGLLKRSTSFGYSLRRVSWSGPAVNPYVVIAT